MKYFIFFRAFRASDTDGKRNIHYEWYIAHPGSSFGKRNDRFELHKSCINTEAAWQKLKKRLKLDSDL